MLTFLEAACVAQGSHLGLGVAPGVVSCMPTVCQRAALDTVFVLASNPHQTLLRVQ